MNQKKYVKRILFITLSNIGDVVLTTPVLIRLSQIYQDAIFDIVGDSRSEILFKNCPFINKFFKKDKSKGFRGVINLIRNIRRTEYDVAVDLRSDGLLYFIKAKKKYYKIRNKNCHSVEKHYLSLRDSMENIPKPEVWISETEKTNAKKLLHLSYKNILAIGLGANSRHKIWPVKFYAQLSNMLKNKYDLIVLVGDIKDSKLSGPFIDSYQGPIINLCGKVDLLTTAAVLQKADLFIGNDSGLGHIASALETKTYTIFGPGQPNRYKPWGEYAYYIQDKLKMIDHIKPGIIYEDIVKKFNI